MEDVFWLFLVFSFFGYLYARIRFESIERKLDVLVRTRATHRPLAVGAVPQHEGAESLAREESFEEVAPAIAPRPAPSPRVAPHPLRSVPASRDTTSSEVSPLSDEGLQVGEYYQHAVASSGGVQRSTVDASQEESAAKWLGRIGSLAVFGGIAFLVKYGFDEGWVTETMLFLLGIVLGAGLVAAGHLVRRKHVGDSAYEGYSAALLGAGISTLYFVLWAGHATLGVIDPSVAFPLMMLVTAMAIMMAVAMDSRFLAIAGVVGGFLTPFIAEYSRDLFVEYSLYVLVLDLGVLGVAWFKKWPWLNYLTFTGTAIIFLSTYGGEPEGTALLFLTLLFLVYLVASVLHHFVRKELSANGDLAFLTMNAAGYFLVAHDILDDRYDAFLGFFALLCSVLFLSVAYAAFTSGTRDRVLTLLLAGIATVFLSVAIPLQFDGHWVSLSWLVESLVLIGIGLMLREAPVKWFGWAVFVFGVGSVIQDVAVLRYGYGLGSSGFYGGTGLLTITPFWNWAFTLLILVAVSFGVIAFLYRRFQPSISWKGVVMVMVVLGNLVFLGGVTTEIDLAYDRAISEVYRTATPVDVNPYGGLLRSSEDDVYGEVRALEEENRTVRLIFWTFYAVLLIVIGFVKRIPASRVGGLILIFLSAVQGFLMVWDLGPIYKIMASIGFGVLALGASYLYVRYPGKLKDIITSDHA